MSIFLLNRVILINIKFFFSRYEQNILLVKCSVELCLEPFFEFNITITIKFLITNNI